MAQIATINPLNQFFALNGSPLNNGKLYFGVINEDPEQNPVQMFWDSAGLVPALQPIRTTSGYPSRSGSPAILYCAVEYSLRVRQSNDVQVFYLPRAGSASLQEFGQWVPTNVTPSFASANSFTMTGDQTAEFQPNRRARFVVTAGTVYGTIVSSVFGALTTVTMLMDGTSSLDSGLESVDLGLMSATNSALPVASATTFGAVRLIDIAPRGHISGYTMSTAGSSATMSIAAGAATDSANVTSIIGAAIAKTTSAWALGTAAGGLDTGAIANNTWYHFYVIRRPDTGVVDATFSTNATTPTLPTNYTQYRRVGSGLTNGSAQWVSFFQLGDEFLWASPTLDIDSTTVLQASTLYALTVPLGIKVDAFMQGFKSGVAGMINIWSPDLGAIGASTSASPLGVLYTDGASPASVNQIRARTNTSRQVYVGATANSQVLKLVTLGWVDLRGKDA